MNLIQNIEGVNKTALKLALLSNVIRINAVKSMKKATFIVSNRAKENISGMHGHVRHIKTGNLRRNIKTKVGWTGLYELEGLIGTDVPYAPHIEALPDGGFLWPALMEVGKEALDYFNEQIVDTINKGGFR